MSKKKVALFDPHGPARNEGSNQNFKASVHYKEIRDKANQAALKDEYCILSSLLVRGEGEI